MKVNVKSKDGTKRVGRDSGSRAELWPAPSNELSILQELRDLYQCMTNLKHSAVLLS
jgi:hypothetical protein